jgi:hypothetical protein
MSRSSIVFSLSSLSPFLSFSFSFFLCFPIMYKLPTLSSQQAYYSALSGIQKYSYLRIVGNALKLTFTHTRPSHAARPLSKALSATLASFDTSRKLPPIPLFFDTVSLLLPQSLSPPISHL